MLRIALRVRLRYAPLRMTHRGIVWQYFIVFNNLIRHSFVVTPSPTGEGYCNRYFQQQIGANQELKVTNLLAFPCEGRGTAVGFPKTSLRVLGFAR